MTTIIRHCQSFHFHKYQVNIFIKPTIVINQNRSHKIRESAGAQVRWSTHNPEEGGLCAGGRQCLTGSAVPLYFPPLTTCSKGHGPHFPRSRGSHMRALPHSGTMARSSPLPIPVTEFVACGCFLGPIHETRVWPPLEPGPWHKHAMLAWGSIPAWHVQFREGGHYAK